jgi:hypothetical protein
MLNSRLSFVRLEYRIKVALTQEREAAEQTQTEEGFRLLAADVVSPGDYYFTKVVDSGKIGAHVRALPGLILFNMDSLGPRGQGSSQQFHLIPTRTI